MCWGFLIWWFLHRSSENGWRPSASVRIVQQADCGRGERGQSQTGREATRVLSLLRDSQPGFRSTGNFFFDFLTSSKSILTLFCRCQKRRIDCSPLSGTILTHSSWPWVCLSRKLSERRSSSSDTLSSTEFSTPCHSKFAMSTPTSTNLEM